MQAISPSPADFLVQEKAKLSPLERAVVGDRDQDPAISGAQAALLELREALQGAQRSLETYLQNVAEDIQKGNDSISLVQTARPGGTDVTKTAVFPESAKLYIKAHGRSFAGSSKDTSKDTNKIAQADFDSNRSTLSDIVRELNDNSQNAQTQATSTNSKIEQSLTEIGTLIDKRNQMSSGIVGNIR